MRLPAFSTMAASACRITPPNEPCAASPWGASLGCFCGSDRGADRAAMMYSLIVTALCRAGHRQVYAARRTMPNGFGIACRYHAGTVDRVQGSPISIRHSLAVQSASRKASRRSFGWKQVRLPRSYGLSFARAACGRAGTSAWSRPIHDRATAQSRSSRRRLAAVPSQRCASACAVRRPSKTGSSCERHEHAFPAGTGR